MLSFMRACRILLLLPPDKKEDLSSSLFPRIITGLLFEENGGFVCGSDNICESGAFHDFDSFRLPILLGVASISLNPSKKKIKYERITSHHKSKEVSETYVCEIRSSYFCYRQNC